MKILTILGARPQFIKASALSREFKKQPEIEEILVHTGQHFDKNMSEVFFREMEIPEPKYNLNINSLSHAEMTGKMLIGIEKILLKEKPDYVLVYGDTNSTLAAALAAKKLNIKLIHVEAGLRSHNMQMPEEINRILTDRISDLLFCPTEQAVRNLKAEGFDKFRCNIILSGDVMYDNALHFADMAAKKSKLTNIHQPESGKYLLCTIHRAENTDNPGNLNQIISALNTLSRDYRIVLPIHPRTRKILESTKQNLNFTPIEPVGYLDMIALIKNSHLVLTDSGGLQKEAYFFNKFCITLREQTEWTELVENHVNFLTGAGNSDIINAVRQLSGIPFPEKSNPYGDGNAAGKICETLITQVTN